MDLRKKILSILFWGIGLINYVWLTNKTASNGFLFATLNVLLLITIIVLVAKYYYAIKICKPNIITLFVIIIFNYVSIDFVFFKDMIPTKDLSKYIYLVCLILMDASLFVELKE